MHQLALAGFEDCAELTPTSLRFTRELKFEEWECYGRLLVSVEGAVRWWLGDWLRYGEGRGDWGEMYSQALNAGSYGGLRNCAWLAGVFELSRRRDNLSWSHHAEVAALEVSEQDRLLDAAEEDGWSHRKLRKAVREYRRALATQAAGPLPAGHYDVILADPPWQYDMAWVAGRAAVLEPQDAQRAGPAAEAGAGGGQGTAAGGGLRPDAGRGA